MRLRSLPDRVRRTLARLARRLARTEERVVRLPAAVAPAAGRALFSYVVDPFLRPGRAASHAHTHDWESWRMATTLAELGFDVDVLHWTNRGFEPRHAYDLFVDVRLQLERLGPRLGGDCLKVMHAETAHASFYNPAQRARLAALEARRGIVLAPFKLLEENRAIEHADAATILGNESTRATYRFAGVPLYPVPISQPFLYPFPEAKRFDEVRRRFVWFGSGGLVHKGLDLVLEAFAGLPDFHLTVIGPVEREREFEHAFARELYRTPNIETVGWVDVGARRFTDLAGGALGLVYASCSEGQSGGTVTCLHAALVPVVTREVGVDVGPELGVVLGEASVGAIRDAVGELARLPADRLRAMARAGWEHARAHHTRERFAAEYRRQMLAILERFRPELWARLSG